MSTLREVPEAIERLDVKTQFKRLQELPRRWKQITVFVLATASCACGTYAAANPYGIAGTGALTTLGMPSGCSEYSWDTLQPSNPINMVRPCKYWVAVGGTHQYWGYHETTDTIDNPTQFASWVTAHLGKTWVIGNEPDGGGQDGLSTDQYARMFHCYYTFIKPLDPTARFAICGQSGGSTAAGLTYATNWYQQALTSYQTQFGTNMPVDVWNVHSYCGSGQIEDPDKIISDFVRPFVQWCHTVQGGAYASCPVWITECPVGEWMGALSPENVIYFMQLYLPRLEQAGIEKWFWYVSIDWDGKQGSCCLTDQSGQITSVGAAYAALANSYPNSVPAVVPFVPYPTPETVLFDFSGAFGPPWFNKAGWWSNTVGELRHTGIYPWPGTGCCPLYVYQDFGLSFRMKINSAPADVNWAGVLIRAASRLHSHSDSGYLFFVRKNGEADLYNKVDGLVASVPGAVADPTAYHNYQAYVSGFHITCYIDGVKRIDWTDPNSRYASGYVAAQTYKADSSFDDFALAKFPRPTPVIADDGVYTTNLTALHAAWDIADTNQTGFQYSVGLSAGATNVVPWTFTTNKSATLALTLNPAWTYYVNVQAVYPGGILGPMASTDGITAQAGGASHCGAVTLTSIPTLSGDTTNDARAITPDGLWVAGVSGARGFLYDVTSGNVYNVRDPFGAQSSLAAGVCYRTSGGQQQVIVGGLAAGWNADYCFTNGTAFAQVRRDNNYGPSGQNPAIGIANVRASGGGDVFWGGWVDIGSSWEFAAVGKVSGVWQGPTTTVATDKTAGLGTTDFAVYGISATGRAVGYRNSTRAHYVLDWTGAGTPTTWSFNGLNGTTAGAAFAISINGTLIFGQSPVSGGRPGSWGYKAVVSSASPGVLQSIAELPSFADTVGTSGSASLPYGCTADGNYAVGMSYRGAEKAVLWDTHSGSAANWTVTDLTDLALAKGAMGIFSRLARAYSVGTDGTGSLVIAGMGLDTNSPAKTRAFLMTFMPGGPVTNALDVTWAGSRAIPTGVRGQNPYRTANSDGVAAMFSMSGPSLMRGPAGGLDADAYDWRVYCGGSKWGTPAGASLISSLDFLRQCRDTGSAPLFTANIFGGGYTNGYGTWVCQFDNHTNLFNLGGYGTNAVAGTAAQLAADWVRYCNILVQTYRQGQESRIGSDPNFNAADNTENLRVYNSLKFGGNWGGRDLLLTNGEPVAPKVTWWEIGNEPEVDLAADSTLVTQHVIADKIVFRDRYRTIANAMKAVDSSIATGPCLVNGINSEWLGRVAEDTNAPLDFVSVHPYMSSLRYAWPNTTNMTTALLDIGPNLASHCYGAGLTLSNYGGATRFGTKPAGWYWSTPLIASEYNPVNWDATWEIKNSMASGLATVEHCFRFAHPSQTTIAFQSYFGANYWEQPQGYVALTNAFEAFRQFAGDLILDNPLPGPQPVPDFAPLAWPLRVYLTRQTNGANKLHVWGLNFSEDQHQAVNFTLTNLPFTVRQVFQRSFGKPGAQNSLTNGTGLGWTAQDASGSVNPSNFTFTVENANFAILTFQETAATNWYWDTAMGGGLQGGSGTWSTNLLNGYWSTTVTGENPMLAWADGRGAVFDAALSAGGTITVTGTVSPRSLVVNKTGCNFTGSGMIMLGEGGMQINAPIQVSSTGTNPMLAGAGGVAVNPGSGNTVTFNGTNTYTGETIIATGTLALGSGGSISDTARISVSNAANFDVAAKTAGFVLGVGQTLAGNGSVVGLVTAYGTVSPGVSVGTLNFSANLTLAGTTVMEVSRNGSTVTNDAIVCAGTLTYGGTLVVTNSGPNSLADGDTFRLFSAVTTASVFGATNLPSLDAGFRWDTGGFGTGVVRVVYVGLGRPAFQSIAQSGTNLILGGSNGVAGTPYYLLTSTNLALPLTDWTPLLTNVYGAGGSFSNNIPMYPAEAARFYRLQSAN